MFDCLFMFSVVTAKELQKWYQGFLKDCPKGVLEKQVNHKCNYYTVDFCL